MSGLLLLGLEEELKDEWSAPPWALGGAMCLYDTILLTCSEPFALFAAMSSTFNFLFKVLFTFPSWYLYTISLKHIFSFT